MSDLEANFRRILQAAIGDLRPNDFKHRKGVYDRAQQQALDARASLDELSLLKKIIREVESEIARSSRTDVERLARRAKTILLAGPLIIGLGFTAIQFSTIPFYRWFEVSDPSYVFKIALTIYFLVLGAGFKFDIDTQKQIYLLDPNRGHFTRNAIISIAFYLGTAIFLFKMSKDPVYFAVGLTVWHFTGMYFWRVLARETRAMVEDSEGSARLRQDNYALQRLQLVRRYISGKWHAPRHILLSILVLLYDLLAIPNPVSKFVAQFWASSSLEPHLLAFVFVVYGALGEGWTWIQRITTLLALRILEALERQFVLTQRPWANVSEEEMLSGIW